MFEEQVFNAVYSDAQGDSLDSSEDVTQSLGYKGCNDAMMLLILLYYGSQFGIKSATISEHNNLHWMGMSRNMLSWDQIHNCLVVSNIFYFP